MKNFPVKRFMKLFQMKQVFKKGSNNSVRKEERMKGWKDERMKG